MNELEEMDYDKIMDDAWITEIEENEKHFIPFYNEENETVDIVYVYINKQNEIQYCFKNTIELLDGIISKEDLKTLIKKHRKKDNVKYKVISLLQYNIDLTPDDVEHYIQKPDNYHFFTKKKKIGNIKWDDSINLFKPLNTLYILYRELTQDINKLTRKNKIKKRHTHSLNKTKKKNLKTKAE